MSYYYARRLGYEGYEDKKKAFRLPSHCARTRCKLEKKIMEKVRDGSRGRSATLKDRRGEKLRAIRTKKDRTGSFEPPCEGHTMCGRRQHEAKLAQKKTPALDRITTGTIPNKKNTDAINV